MMSTATVPCRQRTFPLHLAPEVARTFRTYLQRLQHLLERLGYTVITRTDSLEALEVFPAVSVAMALI